MVQRISFKYQTLCSCTQCTSNSLSSITNFHPRCRLPTGLRMLVLKHGPQASIGNLGTTLRYHSCLVLHVNLNPSDKNRMLVFDV